jgi:hypothetical protein
MEHAAWVPGWYGLDQPLAVGLTGEFTFWRDPPEDPRGGPERLVFYNTLLGSGEALIGSGSVVAISHAELGEIREVDTWSEPFEYAFHLADGTTLEVNAEEEPGRLYEGTGWSSRIVKDWRLSVELDSLSELRPAPRRSEARGSWWDAAGRAEAVRALAALGTVHGWERIGEFAGGSSALSFLLALLTDPDLDMRRAAAFALGEFGDDAAVEPLQRAAKAERLHHRGVYRRAIRAIRKRREL